MTATEKLAMIETGLATGKTVDLITATRIVRITPKLAKSWEAAGLPVVKVQGESLYVARGRSYECADYCAIRVA